MTIALGEDEMRVLEAFGEPAFLIVPNSHHRLDSKIWKRPLSGNTSRHAGGAREKVEKIVSVDATRPDFGDPDVALVAVPGTGESEAALEIRSSHGTTLVLNDVVGNIRNASGFGGWMLR